MLIKIMLALLGLLLLLALLGFALVQYLDWQVASDDPKVWQRAINRFKKMPQEPVDVLFVGSSSIRFWRDLAADMAPLRVQNRGFGGAKTQDILFYYDDLVGKNPPPIIVYYAGDNDLSAGKRKTPAEVLANFEQFVSQSQQSTTPPFVYFLSIKSSPQRMQYWQPMRATNDLLQQFSRQHANVGYIDISASLLDEQGLPDKRLFIIDGVHMKRAGYQKWRDVIRPILLQKQQSRMDAAFEG